MWIDELHKKDINKILEDIKNINELGEAYDFSGQKTDFNPIDYLLKGFAQNNLKVTRRYIFKYVETSLIISKSLDEMFKETNIPVRFWQEVIEDYKSWRFGLEPENRKNAVNEIRLFINRTNFLSGQLLDLCNLIRMGAKGYYKFYGNLTSNKSQNYSALMNKIKNAVLEIETKKINILSKLGYFDNIDSSPEKDRSKTMYLLNAPNILDEDIEIASRQFLSGLAEKGIIEK